MLKAFRLPGFDSITVDDSNSDSCDKEDDDEDIQPIDLKDCLIYTQEHDSCYIHTIQLVVRDGFREAGTMNKILAKAANIVSYVCRSIHANEILEGEKKLQAKVVRGGTVS